ncbi:MAG: Eco57I restriction-modification methylase domain-containing protein [Chloroflexota bacterium]|nr:Eco57I restriction-modification methylase domain-containing protein [Chloroflexota bacterium]
MRGFLSDLDRTERTLHPSALSDFRAVLEKVDQHPNERYFILKSIVLNNLYGVDIMDEAVEICKLRLFLKLVAQLANYEQIEPLPDIDFNVRAGNALVGFSSLEAVRRAMTVTAEGQYRASSDEDRAAVARIESDARRAALAYDAFRTRQTALHGRPTATDKEELRARLGRLDGELNRYLAAEYGVSLDNAEALARWRATHCPFHWFVEFYGIMDSGGFDVVIGNPPYVEYRKVREDYRIRGFLTESCGNLYAFVMERCKEIMSRQGSISMIVPLSGHSTRRMTPLVNRFYRTFSSLHLSTFSGDANPSRMFDGVKFRLAIFVASGRSGGVFTTRYMRWYATERDNLFTGLEYTPLGAPSSHASIPKVSSAVHRNVLAKLAGHRTATPSALRRSGDRILYHGAPVNWIKAHTRQPYFHRARDGHTTSSEIKRFRVSERSRGSVHAILCSSTFFVWWLSWGDCYHLNKAQVEAFPMLRSTRLEYLSGVLEEDMTAKTRRRVYHYKTSGRVEYDEFYMKLSKHIIDDIDRELARHYGFTDEELDFVLNYDVKYRLGQRN